MWVFTRLSGKKRSTGRGTVKTDPNKFEINSYVKVMYFRFVKKLILRKLKTKFENSCIGFFQTRKLAVYKMTSVRKSYTFQSLLKI